MVRISERLLIFIYIILFIYSKRAKRYWFSPWLIVFGALFAAFTMLYQMDMQLILNFVRYTRVQVQICLFSRSCLRRHPFQPLTYTPHVCIYRNSGLHKQNINTQAAVFGPTPLNLQSSFFTSSSPSLCKYSRLNSFLSLHNVCNIVCITWALFSAKPQHLISFSISFSLATSISS